MVSGSSGGASSACLSLVARGNAVLAELARLRQVVPLMYRLTAQPAHVHTHSAGFNPLMPKRYFVPLSNLSFFKKLCYKQPTLTY